MVQRRAKAAISYTRIEAAMESLQALKYEAKWHVNRTVRGKPWFGIVNWKDDWLFNIATLEIRQADLYDDKAGERVFVSWSLRLGQWAKYWFNADQTPWIVNCARTLMTLDHRDDRGPEYMAKKIGTYFTLLLPNAAHGKMMTLFVKTILEAIGELPIASDHHSAGRTRDRFEEALAILLEKYFLKWEWDDGRDDNADRSRGWPHRWLDRKVRVTVLVPSEAVPVIQPPRFGERRIENGNIIAAEIRHIRVEQRLTQKKLALCLGIAQSLLSAIERGERTPSATLLEKIRGLPCLANPPARFDI